MQGKTRKEHRPEGAWPAPFSVAILAAQTTERRAQPLMTSNTEIDDWQPCASRMVLPSHLHSQQQTLCLTHLVPSSYLHSQQQSLRLTHLVLSSYLHSQQQTMRLTYLVLPR